MTTASKSFLFVFPTAILGGAERVMFNIIMHLLRGGNSVTIYIMSRGEQPGWEAVKAFTNATFLVHDYPSEKRSLPMFFMSMMRLSASRRFDVVFSSHTHVNAVLSVMRKLGLIRCRYMVARESTFIFERFFGWRRLVFRFMYRFLYGAQDLLVCQTGMMRQSLIGSLGFSPARRIEVLPNPVNIENIAQMRSEPLPRQMPYLVNVVGCGRLVEVKAFDRLVRAFALVADKFPSAGLVLIGDGPARVELERLVEELSLGDRVFFAGRQSNPINWFAHADVGVVSSLKEGFPNVLLEMMAAGAKQVLSTPCTDGLEAIPGIRILRDCSVEEIASGLEAALSDARNLSAEYQQYVSTDRGVGSFWQKIEMLVSA